MGHRLLHQSHAAGGIGAIPSRSANSRDSREKVKAGGRRPAPVPPKTLARFVILQGSARYPSGPRERSAKPPFVGSNPTRASKPFIYAAFREPLVLLLCQRERSCRPPITFELVFLAGFLSFGKLC